MQRSEILAVCIITGGQIIIAVIQGLFHLKHERITKDTNTMVKQRETDEARDTV